MELFTLGVNQYTQDDVVASAKAWTGHNVDYDADPRDTASIRNVTTRR